MAYKHLTRKSQIRHLKMAWTKEGFISQSVAHNKKKTIKDEIRTNWLLENRHRLKLYLGFHLKHLCGFLVYWYTNVFIIMDFDF